VIDPVPKPALHLWQQVQNGLIESLAPLGADPAARDLHSGSAARRERGTGKMARRCVVSF
jgi:hypothetical protein